MCRCDLQGSVSKAIGDPHSDFRSADRKMNDLAKRSVAKVVSGKRITGFRNLLGCGPRANPAGLGTKRSQRGKQQKNCPMQDPGVCEYHTPASYPNFRAFKI